MHWGRCGLCALILLTICPVETWAISAGQIDTFENGGKANWTNGSGGSSIVNIPTGGPSDVGDHFLQFTSGGFGGSTRLIMFNDFQWSGDFSFAGVVAMALDIKNFGTVSVPMRVAIREDINPADTPGYTSTTPIDIAADGLWHHVIFSLTSSAMTPINSPHSFAYDMENVNDFRILSSVAPATIGDIVSGNIGVDNIMALVPEPMTAAAAWIAILGAIALRRPRRRIAFAIA